MHARAPEAPTGERTAPSEGALSVERSPCFRASKALSVVIVSHRRSRLLLDCLESLVAQAHRDFEILVVDNGGNEGAHAQMARFPVQWIRTGGRSVGLCRRLGTERSSGEVLVFLDDDCRPTPDLTAEIVAAFGDPALYALRGRVLPRTGNGYNRLHRRYDRGDGVLASPLDVECVVAVRREALCAVGGWRADLFGHEGIELSMRLAERFGREGMVYHPRVLVNHDYAAGLRGVLRKSLRHIESMRRIEGLHPGVRAYLSSYDARPHRRHPGTLAAPRHLKVRLAGELRKLFRRHGAVRAVLRPWLR